MQDTDYPVAYWGKSWDEVTQYSEDADSESVQGVANLIDNVPILHASSGELLPVSPDKPTESPLPKPEYLYGHSKFGDYFALRDPTLMNTESSLQGTYEQNIKGIFLFAGKKQFDSSKAVTQAYVEIIGLKEWAYEISVEDNPEQTEYILFEDKTYQIKLEQIVKPSSTASTESLIDYNYRLNITFKSEMYFNEALKVTEELADFFTLCQGFYAGIESLKLKFSDCPSTVKCLSSFPESCLDTNKIYRMPFPYSTIKDNLETMLQKWLYMPEDRKHAEVILASLMSESWNMPFDLVFISLSQVLEVLSKANVDLRSLPKAQYKKYRKIVLNSIKDEEVRNWLFPDKFPKDQKGQQRLLTELLEAHETFIQWLIPGKDEFIKNQITERNRYTHISAKSKKKKGLDYESLYWHTNAVRFVCYGVSFALLGLKEEDIIDALQDSSFEYMIERVRKFYKYRC